jgi:hypothetical protein
MPTLTATIDALGVLLSIAGAQASGVVYGVKLTGLTQDGQNAVPVALWAYSASGSQNVSITRGPWVVWAVEGASVSNVQHLYVPDATDGIHGEIFDAVYARVCSLALPGIADRVHQRVSLENIGGQWPAVLLEIPNGLGESPGPNNGSNERSDWGFAVRVTIADRLISDMDPDVQLKPLLKLRRIVLAAFDRVRLSPPESVFDCRVEPGAVKQEFATENGKGYRVLGTVLTVRAIARLPRGF